MSLNGLSLLASLVSIILVSPISAADVPANCPTTALGPPPVRFQTAPGQMLKDAFVTQTFNVDQKSQCAQRCNTSEVYEIVTADVDVDASYQCRCSRVPSVYLDAFPNRYLTKKDTTSAGCSRGLFYLPPSTDPGSILPFKVKPVLFYALDDISGGQNLGSLDPARYSLDMGKVSPHYDCPWLPLAGTSSAIPTGRPQMMRMVPQDKQINQLQHDSVFNSLTGITAMVWFKQRSGVASNLPIIMNHNVKAGTTAWYMFNWDYESKPFSLHVWFGPPVGAGFVSAPNLFRQASWNNLAFRVNNATTDYFLNGIPLTGTEARTLTALPSPLNKIDMGDLLKVGSYQDQFFDGCLAHTMVFNRALTNAELSQYLTLLQDDLF